MDFLNHVANVFRNPEYITDSKILIFMYRLFVLFLLFNTGVTLYYNVAGTPITCEASHVDSSRMEKFCVSSGVCVYGRGHETNQYRQVYPLGFHTRRDMTVVEIKNPQWIDNTREEHKFVTSYWWYNFCYFCMAFFLYLARYYWRGSEGSCIAEVVRTHNDKKLSRADIVDLTSLSALQFAQDLIDHNFFVIKYVAYLLVYLLVFVAELGLILYYVAHGYLLFAVDAIKYFGKEYNTFPYDVALIFPRRVTCLYSYGGAGGNKVTTDALCDMTYSPFHQRTMSLIFFSLCFAILFVTLEIIWVLINCMCPRFARLWLRILLWTPADSNAGKAIARLNGCSCIMVQFLFVNMHRQRLLDILVRVKMEFDIGYRRLRRQAHGYV